MWKHLFADKLLRFYINSIWNIVVINQIYILSSLIFLILHNSVSELIRSNKWWMRLGHILIEIRFKFFNQMHIIWFVSLLMIATSHLVTLGWWRSMGFFVNSFICMKFIPPKNQLFLGFINSFFSKMQIQKYWLHSYCCIFLFLSYQRDEKFPV